MLFQKLARSVRDHLAEVGVYTDTPLLLACSGGRDSVFLTELLREASFSALTLVHLDHGLRADSAADSAWVQHFGAERNLETIVERLDVREFAKENSCGVEEAGREARYAFFARIGQTLNCARVLLAHHADDQVETFLFRLLRGAGANGLRGMTMRSERREGDFTLEVLRPMLHIWREEIDRCVAAVGIEFREDSSNTDSQWTRNRIRHELIPFLSQVMQRPVRTQLAHASELLRAEAEFVEAAESALGPLPEQLEVEAMRALPLALQRRRMFRWLSERGIPELSFELVDAALSLLTRRQPAKHNLPGGSHIRRRNGVIFCEPPPLRRGIQKDAS